MDAAKFAFDTLIVGALALPWLALFARMFFAPPPPATPQNHLALISALPEHTRESVASVLILAIGYFLGTAVTRISNQLFDDELWFVLPTESTIRTSVYLHEYCEIHDALKTIDADLGINLPVESGRAAKAEQALCSPKTAPLRRDLVTELFRIQEGRLLLNGEDKIARLKEFHDQIIILRGTTLNGTVLAVLSVFGICACYRARSPHRFGRAVYYLPAIGLLAYGIYSLIRHYTKALSAGLPAPHRSPPLAEFVLILLGICGLLVCRRVDKEDLRVFRNVWVLAVALSVIAYGAWWWTEVMYDEQVIHSGLQGPRSALAADSHS